MSILWNSIILLATWLLLRYNGKGLVVLFGSGFLYRFLQLVAGFVCSAFLAGSIGLVFSAIANFSWQPATGLGIAFLLKGFYNTLSNVLLEALVFRGALLYLAINQIGEKGANLFSALAFGIYHWFTLQVFGSPVIMVWVLVYMGVWGLLLAYAYSRTGSLALPVGLHLGWGFIDQYIFNRQGESLFIGLTTVHTRYLSTLEKMLYLQLPTIAFAVIMIVLLCRFFPVKVNGYKGHRFE